MASILLLILGVAALVGVINARWPRSALLLEGLSWLWGWIAIELAPQIAILGALAAGVLVALGGLDETTGVIGLAALVLAEVVGIGSILALRRTEVDLGEDGAKVLAAGRSAAPYPRSHALFPFLAWRTRGRGIAVDRAVPYTQPPRRACRLDVYRPAGAAGEPRPAIINVHGGGWMLGSRHEQGVPLLSHLAANGWVGFNIDYRLSPRATWPDLIVDVKRAIAWVRQHAAEYGADPNFIAITGGSAGGHLSALAALSANDPAFQPGFEDADTSVAAAVPFYGIYDFLDLDRENIPIVGHVLERLVFKARRRDDPERFRQASPLYRVHPDAPPTLVIHGEKDSLVPVRGARRLVDALRATSRSPVLYLELAGAQHAFDIVPSWRTVEVIDVVERFLVGVHEQSGVNRTAVSTA